jgi:hypothetical protein
MRKLIISTEELFLVRMLSMDERDDSQLPALDPSWAASGRVST